MSSLLENLENGFSAAILGASGGIGSAFETALQNSDQCRVCLALSRSNNDFDIGNPDSLATLSGKLMTDGFSPQLIVVATGILSPAGTRPEKSMRELDFETMIEVFKVNTVGPAMMIRYLTGLLPRNKRSVFALLSARVGSIADNRAGGWYSYRASKAALNQVIKTASIELKRTRPEAILVGLQPGTVDTGLSAEYQCSNKLPPEKSVHSMLNILGGLQSTDSGKVFDYKGEVVPW